MGKNGIPGAILLDGVRAIAEGSRKRVCLGLGRNGGWIAEVFLNGNCLILVWVSFCSSLCGLRVGDAQYQTLRRYLHQNGIGRTVSKRWWQNRL